MRNIFLSDFHLTLQDATSFILNSNLGRKALQCRQLPGFSVFIIDLIAKIHSLTLSCHLPEFTDHGIHHLCSIVDRVSRWSCKFSRGKPKCLCERINTDEAAVLLLAILIHDIGMLSQKPEDLEEGNIGLMSKGQMEVATWVRKTHINRIKKLVIRLFSENNEHQKIINHKILKKAFRIAKAYRSWPWEKDFLELQYREFGLAAVLAVVDMLDEDSNRCDTSTLLHHRQGTMLNTAHWIRHTLTENRILVENNIVNIRLVRPPKTDSKFEIVFAALRNHYRLIKLYNKALMKLGIRTLDVCLNPEKGCPKKEVKELNYWWKIPGFPNQNALIFHLVSSFFPLALRDEKRESRENIAKLKTIKMEEIDLEFIRKVKGEIEIRSSIEQEFYAIISEN